MLRVRVRLAIVAGAVALLLGASAAYALDLDESAVYGWRLTVKSDPGVDDAAWRLYQRTHRIDPRDPWAPTTEGDDSQRPEVAMQPGDFHRWRTIDNRDPWTSRPVERATPSLRTPELDPSASW